MLKKLVEYIESISPPPAPESYSLVVRIQNTILSKSAYRDFTSPHHDELAY